MPKVASEVKVQAHSGIRVPNRPADKTDGNPFAALLDTVASPDRQAAKSDRTEPSRPGRKSEASKSQNQCSDDAAPAQQDSSAASADAGVSEKSDGKDQGTESPVAENAAAETAPAETKDTIDADLAAAIDAAIAATAAPQIVQAAVVVAAPSIAPVEVPALATDEVLAAIAAPATDAVAAADIATAAAPADAIKAAAAVQTEAGAAPVANTDESGKPAIQPTDLTAAQKQPRDGSHVKTDTPAKEIPEAVAKDNAAPEQKPIKADTGDIDLAPKTAHLSAEQTQGFTLPSLHSHGATASTATQAAAAPVANAVPISGIAVEIAAHARAGGNRFEIRLDPPELGRIDVRLDVDKNGQVTTHLRVDRVETLDMLRRDAQNLERTLQDAGLKMSGNALNFSLRDQSPHQHAGDHHTSNSPQHLVADDTGLPVGGAQVSAWATRLGGIDIRV